MSFGAPSVKGRALMHLARREHSRTELRRKLMAQVRRSSGGQGDEGADPEEAQAAASAAARQIDAVLDELTAQGLLSDDRTARAVLEGRGQRLGVRRLKQVLLTKGLAPDLVAGTLQQARASEFERALQAWRKRFGTPAGDAADRARQARFLAGRGFEPDVIARVLRGAVDED